MHKLARTLVVLAAAALTAAVATAATPWPTNHGNNLRSGYYPSGTKYSKLSRAWGKGLDGAVYGSPIVLNTWLVVATENNTVYELNATTGAVRWMHHLMTPAPTSSLACPGNISPSGITGTPAFDPKTNRIFVVTTSVASGETKAHHEFIALNATTGKTEIDRRITVPGQAENAEQERGALTVAGGYVYVPFGGLAGDCGQYKGALVSLRTNGQLGGTAWVVPTGREGGIWAPGGPAVLPDGTAFVAIGNGESVDGSYDGSDSVTRISPNSKRLDFFAPTTWASDNASDLDLGSMTPALTSNGHILQVGKSGTAYVLQTSHLGGIGGQVSIGNLCKAFGVSAVTGNTVYLPCTDGLSRVDISATGQLHRDWQLPSVTSSPVAGNGALYAVSGTNLVAISGNGVILGSTPLGSTPTRFATPALEGNKAFVGTLSGIVAMNVG